ncbi:MAG: tail protein X [Pasteurellaceae bacterium]|nr:tail protein X [Pasteurellaceae bacterium]
MKLIAHQDETLDALLYRYDGNTERVEMALALNPELANQPVLKMGQVVEMPDLARHRKATKTTVQLWD